LAFAGRIKRDKAADPDRIRRRVHGPVHGVNRRRLARAGLIRREEARRRGRYGNGEGGGNIAAR
jgi:hypothetical protein